jgi:hypothetical protein
MTAFSLVGAQQHCGEMYYSIFIYSEHSVNLQLVIKSLLQLLDCSILYYRLQCTHVCFVHVLIQAWYLALHRMDKSSQDISVVLISS